MRLLFCLLVLTLVISVLAQPDPRVAEELRYKLEGYLARLDPNMSLTRSPAEEGFIAQGREALPVMREMYSSLGIMLATAEAEGRQEEIRRLRFQMEFLDRVMVRRQLDFNPPAEIREWVRRQYKPEDQYIADIIPEPQRITDMQLENAFPGYLFYVARFPQYPVAREIPPPLSANNLFAVQRDKTGGLTEWRGPPPQPVALMTESVRLRIFFLAYWKLGRIAGNPENLLKDVAYTWLRLSEELHNDGFYRFAIPAESLQVTTGEDGYCVTGRADVMPTAGNSGSITAVLTFDRDKKLINVKEEVKLQPGIRPICQATKLLDPDPIVRKMAEQDLLIMGPAAYEYMMEQREKAEPELRAAIERMWERILERERQR
jgi:hypothetical protein